MKSILAGIAVLVILFTIQVSAQNGQGRRGNDRECFRMSNLNLTDAQESKLNEIRDKHITEVGKLRDELGKLRIDKRAMVRDKNLNRNNYLEMEKKMIDLRGKIAQLRAEHQMDVYEMLTDEQKQEFRKSPKGMMGNRGERMHRRGFKYNSEN